MSGPKPPHVPAQIRSSRRPVSSVRTASCWDRSEVMSSVLIGQGRLCHPFGTNSVPATTDIHRNSHQ